MTRPPHIAKTAGFGSLCDAIKERFPQADISAVEVRHYLANVCRMAHPQTVSGDFLEYSPPHPDLLSQLGADRVIMNPPFEHLQDCDHVRHAFQFLKPGGRLVAIMGESAFQRKCSKADEFRTWFANVGGESEQIDGAFSGADAFHRTAVNVRMIVIDKDAENV